MDVLMFIASYCLYPGGSVATLTHELRSSCGIGVWIVNCVSLNYIC